MRANHFRESAQRDGLAEQAVEQVDCKTFRFDRVREGSVEHKLPDSADANRTPLRDPSPIAASLFFMPWAARSIICARCDSRTLVSLERPQLRGGLAPLVNVLRPLNDKDRQMLLVVAERAKENLLERRKTEQQTTKVTTKDHGLSR